MNGHRVLLGTALLAALTAIAAAPPPRHVHRAEPEDLARWQWYHPIPAPPRGKLADFVVPPSVFGRSQPQLADLRLIDSQERPVPYALRIRTPVNTQDPITSVKSFDRVTHADRSGSLTLDLGANFPEHNEVEVQVAGRAYARPLVVEGSDDGKTWVRLLHGVHLVRLQVAGRWVEEKRFRYAPSRLRYVRVRVWPDRVLEKDEPEITSARIFRSVTVPGEENTIPATLQSREPVRQTGIYASAWRIDLGADNVPCSKLILQIDDEEFVRHYTLEQLPREGQPTLIATGELRRHRDKPAGPLEVTFPEMQVRRLRLTVMDDRNPPLQLTAVKASAAARQIVFAPPPGGGPLRLYSGNPKANAPNYDFAATLPALIEPPPVRVQVGEPEDNPKYVPEPKPWTERWPYLVDSVLGVASAVLLGVLGILARTAIHRHDELSATADAPPA
jgi:hypothetical protein